MVRQNEYFNALQVKYANAVTCHKAQGGQWKEIYVDAGYLTPKTSTKNTCDGYIPQLQGLPRKYTW